MSTECFFAFSFWVHFPFKVIGVCHVPTAHRIRCWRANMPTEETDPNGTLLSLLRLRLASRTEPLQGGGGQNVKRIWVLVGFNFLAWSGVPLSNILGQIKSVHIWRKKHDELSENHEDQFFKNTMIFFLKTWWTVFKIQDE